MTATQEFTVIFLINAQPPARLLLLRRAAHKTFAPAYYTGIGGKVGDLPGLGHESVLQGAYRELAEETENDLSRDNIILHTFARCIIDGSIRLHYFYGLYPPYQLPRLDPADGTLTWVNSADLLHMDLIPTTKAFCQQWKNRGFSTTSPFTVYLQQVGFENSVRLVKLQKVLDGLRG